MRRVLFYTISFTCAVAINLVLISLLILASPKNTIPLNGKTQTTEFNLSQNTSVNSSAENIPQPKILALETKPTPPSIIQTQKASFELAQETEEEQFERNIFFSKGQQILASLQEVAPQKTTPAKKLTTIDCLNRNKTHCYCSKTLSHIAVFYTALKKKNARSLAQWYEQPTTKPDLTVHVEKDGSLRSIKLTKSSGSSMHDKLYVQAIKQAAPFPRIPDHFRVNELIFEL